MRLRSLTQRLLRNPRSRKRTFGTALICFSLFIILISILMFISHVRPMVIDIALASATDEITLAVNDIVSEMMSEGELDYSNLVTLEKDEQGNITALITNVSVINTVQAELTNRIVEYFFATDITPVSIPLGSLIGGAVLSGRGPRITFDILSVTNVATDFRHEFSSAGINQTRHQIMMDVEVTFGILLNRYRDYDTVLTEVSIAETVIVGEVPDTYASFG